MCLNENELHVSCNKTQTFLVKDNLSIPFSNCHIYINVILS